LYCTGIADHHDVKLPNTCQPASKPKFSKPISYYSNCTSTFRTDLLECGDIHPHPGPTKCDSSSNTNTDSPYHQVQKLKGLKILSLNINSLSAKIDELRLMAYETKFDIIALMETKINDTFWSSKLAITGYDFHRRDMSRNGGGIALYINSQLPYTMLDPTLPTSSETLWIKLSFPCTRPILLGAVYRSQIETNFCETFSNTLHKLLEPLNKGRNPCEIVCVGDFNFDQFKKKNS